jgi:hypothetical protein
LSRCSAKICSAKPSLAKLDVPKLETEGSGISKSSGKLGKTVMAKPKHLRTSLICYLEILGHITDRKVWRQTLKYVLLDHDLYRRTIDGLVLKCWGLDQSKIAMG